MITIQNNSHVASRPLNRPKSNENKAQQAQISFQANDKSHSVMSKAASLAVTAMMLGSLAACAPKEAEQSPPVTQQPQQNFPVQVATEPTEPTLSSFLKTEVEPAPGKKYLIGLGGNNYVNTERIGILSSDGSNRAIFSLGEGDNQSLRGYTADDIMQKLVDINAATVISAENSTQLNRAEGKVPFIEVRAGKRHAYVNPDSIVNIINKQDGQPRVALRSNEAFDLLVNTDMFLDTMQKAGTHTFINAMNGDAHVDPTNKTPVFAKVAEDAYINVSDLARIRQEGGQTTYGFKEDGDETLYINGTQADQIVNNLAKAGAIDLIDTTNPSMVSQPLSPHPNRPIIVKIADDYNNEGFGHSYYNINEMARIVLNNSNSSDLRALMFFKEDDFLKHDNVDYMEDNYNYHLDDVNIDYFPTGQVSNTEGYLKTDAKALLQKLASPEVNAINFVDLSTDPAGPANVDFNKPTFVQIDDNSIFNLNAFDSIEAPVNYETGEFTGQLNARMRFGEWLKNEAPTPNELTYRLYQAGLIDIVDTLNGEGQPLSGELTPNKPRLLRVYEDGFINANNLKHFEPIGRSGSDPTKVLISEEIYWPLENIPQNRFLERMSNANLADVVNIVD